MWTVGGTTPVLSVDMDYASAQVDVATLVGFGAGVKVHNSRGMRLVKQIVPSAFFLHVKPS